MKKFNLPSSNHTPYSHQQETKKNVKVFYRLMKDLGYKKNELQSFVESIINLEHNESSIEAQIKFLMPGIAFEKYDGDRIVGILNVINFDSRQEFLKQKI